MNLIQKVLNGIGTARRSMVSLQYEPVNVSSNAKVADVQGMIRAAEAGETRQLFALYRDLSISGSHVLSELTKRKLAILSEPHAILPVDKNDKDDLFAAEACRVMIGNCENWHDGLTHLMDSTIWPVAVCEKIFRPGGERDVVSVEGRTGVKLQYGFKRFEPVNPTVLCFRQPYGGNTYRPQTGDGPSPLPVLDPNAWESDLRFYKTDETGMVLWNYADSYPADPMLHLVHRGHLLVGVRDNWGGPMRAIVFWWLLSVLGRDWFGRYMERYGQPFIVGKTDSTSTDAVTFLKDALSLATKIGGIVVDHETELELKEAMSANAADAYERFLSVCNKEVSKVILGQTLSADAQPTGLGSGTSNLQGEVREDYKSVDRIKLGFALRSQLFEPFLRINGIPGRAPLIVWGDMTAEESASIADLLVKLSEAGLEPTDEALPTISEKVGFQLQRKAMPDPMGFPGTGRPRSELALTALSASIPSLGHPSDRIVEARAKALAEAYRGAMAPIRVAILSSSSREDCLKKLQLLYPDWNPTRLADEMETALQICAAAGAASGAAGS